MFELRNILTQAKHIFKKSCLIDGVTFSCHKNANLVQLGLKNSTENVIRTQFGHLVKPGGNIKLEFDLKKSCTVTLDDRKNPVLVRWGGDKLRGVKSEQVSEEVDKTAKNDPTSSETVSKLDKSKDEKMCISQDDEFELQESESDDSKSTQSSKWTEAKNYIEFSKNLDPKKQKFAIFDMDYTMIKPASGRRFPKDHLDWMWLYGAKVHKQMNEASNSGYQIVILSNQSGLSTKKKDSSQKIANFKLKIAKITEKLDSCLCFFTTEKSICRKPCDGLINLKYFSNIDKENSFYCGDAAGRTAENKSDRKKDFAASDLQWAMNVGIKFHTPEEYFLDQKQIYPKVFDFEPSDLTKTALTTFTPFENIVMIVGLAASGKSTLAEILSKQGYEIINQDKMKTKERCQSEFKRLVKIPGQKIVLDNTNTTVAQRGVYLKIAKEFSVKIECVELDVDMVRLNHNSAFRNYVNPAVPLIPTVVMNTQRKHRVEVDESEGFERITKFKNPVFELLN